jgi:glycine/betaine/sarcosine/D-proline reductase family selenoprotein B
MTPIAEMVGSHRIVTGNGIVHPLGAADATPEAELQLRRRILERAAAALTTPVEEPTVLS